MSRNLTRTRPLFSVLLLGIGAASFYAARRGIAEPDGPDRESAPAVEEADAALERVVRPALHAEVGLFSCRGGRERLNELERRTLAEPDEAGALKAALVYAFSDVDARDCFRGSPLVGDLVLEFSVDVRSSREEAFFSNARFVQIRDGMPVPESTLACVASFRQGRGGHGRPAVSFVRWDDAAEAGVSLS